MKKLLSLLLIIVIAAAAFITNPAKSRHKEVMHEAVAEASAEYMENHTSGTIGGIFGGLLSGLTSNVLNAAIDTQLNYHNYYLFSTCTMRVEGEQKLVSLGLFNQIITMDKDDVLEALGENPSGDDESQEEEDTI